MSFDWTWSTSADVETRPEHFGTKVHSSSGAHVTWTCEYSSRLVLSTASFDVDEATISDKLFSSGAFNSGFSLTLHEGPDLSTEIGQKDRIFNTRILSHRLLTFKSVTPPTCSGNFSTTKIYPFYF